MHICAMNTIRVVIFDDSNSIREAISLLIDSNEEFVLGGSYADATHCIEVLEVDPPDVVLMDIDMPQMSGLAAAEVLHREMPHLKVLILSMHSNKEYVLRIIQSGARGFVLKEASTEELVRAIETVNSGEAYFSSDVARVALNQFVRGSGESPAGARLTNREMEVLIHIADGLSNKEIAAQLGIGVRTAETHRERIMRKLDIHTIAGLTRYAVAKGLVTLNGCLAA